MDKELRGRLSEQALRDSVEQVPADWLPEEGPSVEGYLSYFRERLAKSRFVEEALRAYAKRV